MLLSGGTMTGNINSSHYFNWAYQYGLSWTNRSQLTCDMNGDMYFNLYAKSYYFQQTWFTKVSFNSIGIVICYTATIPLQISTYVASTQTYKCLNSGGIGGPGTYTMNYNYSIAIVCNFAVCASEYDAFSDERIKINIQNLCSSLDIILQLRPITFNYHNENKYGTNIRYGLITQQVKEIVPSIVNLLYGVIDNVNSEFNKKNIKKNN